MSQRLFNVSKVGLFLDDYSPVLEKRKSGEVKVLVLALRVQPFDAKLAQAIDDGLGEDSNVRSTLFKLSHPDPKPHLSRVNFTTGCPRQNLLIYASPDTKQARIHFPQVRISGTYARTEKNVNGYAFVFKASYGPVGRAEQEYIHEWMLSQRFVTFEESEPSLEFKDGPSAEEDEGNEQDQKARRPAGMFDTDKDGKPIDAGAAAAKKDKDKPEPANRKLHSIADKKKKGARRVH